MDFAYNLLIVSGLLLLLAVTVAVLVADVWRKTARQMTRCGLLVFLVGAVIATVEAQKSTNAPPRSLSAPVPAPPTATASLDGTNVVQDVDSPLVFNSFGVDTNGVFGTFTWRGRNDGGSDAATIDFFASWPTLTNGWLWLDAMSLQGPVVSQEWAVAFSDFVFGAAPSSLFLKMQDRQTLAVTMDDVDGDGIPDLYEMQNGTNPYVPDYADAPKLTVGPDGVYRTLSSALAASADYSIVEITGSQYLGELGLKLPPHPVMITGPIGGYALITSRASPCAFRFEDEQDNRTIIQNIYLDMLPSSGLQAAFWCGYSLTGGMPCQGMPASATFRNIYVRAAGSHAYGRGWIFSGWNDSPAAIEKCVINAAGSTEFGGIEVGRAPELRVTDCTFVNFPTNGAGVIANDSYHTGCTSSVQIARCVFDESFTNAHPFVRIQEAPHVILEDSILPENFKHEYVADRESGIIIGTNCVSWFGYAVPGGAADRMGIGALAAIGEASTLDSDLDGLTDWDEIYTYSTDPFKSDTDGDKIPDGVEITYGTNPRLSTDFAFALTVDCPSAFLTNAPTWVVIDDGVHEPVAVTAACQTVEWIVRSFSDGSLPELSLSNEQYQVYYSYRVKNPFVFVSTAADLDRDGLDDGWELLAGLCPTNKNDALQDADGDGLINLHEYWAGTDPLTPDGSNTLLSVCARSVDDRLAGVNTTNDVCRFVDFFHNASNEVFVINTNLWCRDVDLSCVSIWHHDNDEYETRGTKTATAITHRHVLLSNHWHSNRYRFCDTNGNVVVREHDRIEYVYGDTRLARLTVPLPESVVPARLLSDDYAEYLWTGKYLPSVCVNEKQQVVVGELQSMSTGIDGYQNYVQVASTNIITESRERIRGAISIGQSSSPVFLLVENTPALIMVKHLGYPESLQWNPTWGPSLPYYIDTIQRRIDSWEGEGAYRLDVIDLSAFRKLDE